MKKTLLSIIILSLSLVSCSQTITNNENKINLRTDNVSPLTEKEKIIIEKSIGDTINLATINLTINKVEEKNILNAKYSTPTIARDTTKFIILDVEITNTTKETFFNSDEGFIIVDDLGRSYTPYSTIGKIDNYINMRDLSPSIAEQWKMVFEVPKDSQNYYFRVFKWGTNEEIHIKL